jgi:hypothetical protein
MFGYAVAIRGDVAVVGAVQPSSQGSAYVFRFTGSTWIEEQKVKASDPATYDWFGCSVSLGDGVFVAGAYGHDAAYVLRFDGSHWVHEQKLVATSGPGKDFGCSVSLDGNLVLIGSWGDDGFAGSAYVFHFDGVRWVEEQRLTASDSETYSEFGFAVSVSGNVALVGKPSDKSLGGDEEAGSAYFFAFDGASWIEKQKLVDPNPFHSEQLGISVSLAGDLAAIGSIGQGGAAHLYRFDGSSWHPHRTITPADGAKSDRFGWGLSLGGSHLLLGAYGDDDGGHFSGSAYAYAAPNLTLGATPSIAGAGDTLALETRGGTPIEAVVLALVEVNRAPFLHLLGHGWFDLHGAWGLSAVVPPGLSGLELGLQCFGDFGPGEWGASNRATVSFR